MTVAESKIGARAQMAGRLAEASLQGLRHRATFDAVQTYCMFIGYPRSGHSLVGALLDAHPNVVITHELDALRYIQGGHMTRDRLFWLIVNADRASSRGRRTRRYDYSVEGQWQGRSDRLQVIGDKMGGESTLRLGRRPELLDSLAAIVAIPMRLIHVVRNPFDNIATMHVRNYGTLAECADKFFSMCTTNAEIRRRDDMVVMDIRHEDLIAEPSASLAALCRFLGVETTPDYLGACASIVNPSPHRSRAEVEWPPALLDQVHQRMEQFDFLHGYAFATDHAPTEGPTG